MAHSNESAHHAHHPTPATYAKIATTLVLITGVEIGAFYLNMPVGALIALLVSLSMIKFGLVVAFYMHLKFDAKVLTWFFVGGLLLAMAVVIALTGIFHSKAL